MLNIVPKKNICRPILALPFLVLSACESDDGIFEALAAASLGYAVAETTGNPMAAMQVVTDLTDETKTNEEKTQIVQAQTFATPLTSNQNSNAWNTNNLTTANLDSTDLSYSSNLVREATNKVPALNAPSGGNCPDTLEWIAPRLPAAQHYPETAQLVAEGLRHSVRADYQAASAQGMSPALVIQESRNNIRALEAEMENNIRGIRATTPDGSLTALQNYVAGQRYTGASMQEAHIRSFITRYVQAEIIRGGMINIICYTQEARG